MSKASETVNNRGNQLRDPKAVLVSRYEVKDSFQDPMYKFVEVIKHGGPECIRYMEQMGLPSISPKQVSLLFL